MSLALRTVPPFLACALVVTAVLGFPRTTRATTRDAAGAAAAAQHWMELYRGKRFGALCGLIDESFTSRSDWGGKTGKTIDKDKFCRAIGAHTRNPTLLVFNIGDIDVKFDRGTPASGYATVSYRQYFCQERPGYSYSSIGDEQLRLRWDVDTWRYVHDRFVGAQRQSRKGCLPRPEPQRTGCSRESWCPSDPVLFDRLLEKVCRGNKVTREEFTQLGARDLRVLFKSFSALYGYTFPQADLLRYFYGPGAADRHPAACRFVQDPTYGRSVKKTRLSPAEFRQQVEMRDHYKLIR